MARRLSEQERRFAEAFVGEARGNATEAARLAGYSAKGVARQGHDLLKRDRVVEHIEKLRAPTTSAAYVTRDEGLALLASMVRGELLDERLSPTGEVVSVAPSLADRRAALKDIAAMEGWAKDGLSGRALPLSINITIGDHRLASSVDLAAHIPAELDDDDEIVVLPDNGRMLTQ